MVRHMAKLKLLLQQVFMISTGTLFIIGINGTALHFMGEKFIFEWYEPFSIILMGILCAIPTTIFILNDNSKQRSFVLRLILHCISIWIIIAVIGKTFGWYDTLCKLILVSAEYLAIYIFVWLTSIWFVRIEDRKINQALMNIQDEE